VTSWTAVLFLFQQILALKNHVFCEQVKINKSRDAERT
jgi:hypothetical protein